MSRQYLGIDIGTTTVAAAVTDDKGHVIHTMTQAHGADIQGRPFESLQDADRLTEMAAEIYREAIWEYDITAVGVTGQQHGIVYLDGNGKVLSPLYNWRDRRGEEMHDEKRTWAKYLSDVTGYPAATGYGLVTHAYNLAHGLVSDGAECLCTIQDLAVQRLAGLARPVTEPSDAASLGFYDVEKGAFDTEALKKIGIDPAILPEVRQGAWVGETGDGVKVAPAIGDNQASFIGATGGDRSAMLLNIGTSGQLSVYSPVFVKAPPFETRPFPTGGYLLAGSVLCGGKAWAMLEDFFEETVKAFTGRSLKEAGTDGYRIMGELAEAYAGNAPQVDTAFDGTREEPAKRGSITGIDRHNLTPASLCRGMIEGMIGELRGFCRGREMTGIRLYGSGNCLKLNPALQREAERQFGTELIPVDVKEEAACGAAIYAATL